MTPATICGIARLNGLESVALTDHNTAKNCPAFQKAAEFYGLKALFGMELTTAEDIHLVCLFDELSAAMSFDEFVNTHRIKIPNRPDIFGNQLIMNEDDEIIGRDEFLLINATDITIEDAKNPVETLGGICYPAHIDREANGVIATLGVFPHECGFEFFELHDAENQAEYSAKYGLGGLNSVISSDAHSIPNIKQ